MLRDTLGDFEDWFCARFGWDKADVRVLDAQRLPELPAIAQMSCLIITGSPAMVSHRADWSERCVPWLQTIVASNLPTLGVCYGHQLLAHALGGAVGPNPNGREIGTVQVEIPEGASVLGMPQRTLHVQATHCESVITAPAGVSSLGRSALEANQILQFGSHAWGTQFHPEFDAQIIRGYIEARKGILEAEGLDTAQLLDALKESDDGAAFIDAFARRYLQHAERGHGEPPSTLPGCRLSA